MTTSRSLRRPTLRLPFMKMLKLERVEKRSGLLIRIKEAKAKFHSLLIEPRIVVVSLPSIKTEPSPFNAIWTVKTLHVIR
jgi:hypothetical protein